MAGFNFELGQGDGDHSGKIEFYSVDAAHATLLAPGDVVTVTGTANTDGVAGVDAGTAGSAITGVVAAFEPQFVGENLNETGLPAGDAGAARVHIDPNLNFLVDVINGPLTAADVQQNADADFTAATKTGGLTISNMTLDAATVAATATLQFKIVGLAPNNSGVVDGTRARVRFNSSTLATGTAGV